MTSRCDSEQLVGCWRDACATMPAAVHNAIHRSAGKLALPCINLTVSDAPHHSLGRLASQASGQPRMLPLPLKPRPPQLGAATACSPAPQAPNGSGWTMAAPPQQALVRPLHHQPACSSRKSTLATSRMSSSRSSGRLRNSRSSSRLRDSRSSSRLSSSVSRRSARRCCMLRRKCWIPWPKTSRCSCQTPVQATQAPRPLQHQQRKQRWHPQLRQERQHLLPLCPLLPQLRQQRQHLLPLCPLLPQLRWGNPWSSSGSHPCPSSCHPPRCVLCAACCCGC